MDLDRDGHRDVISGSWPGQIFIFRGQAGGAFAPREPLLGRNGKPLYGGWATSVFAVDWEGDGDMDLLTGNIDGYVALFRNHSGNDTLAFDRPRPLQVGGRSLKLPEGDAGPCAADWDGDGDLDLLVGTDSGEVLFYANESPEGEPSLISPQVLVKGAGVRARASDGHATRAKLCVTDWNQDGKLDLLLGDYDSGPQGDHGWVWLYLRN